MIATLYPRFVVQAMDNTFLAIQRRIEISLCIWDVASSTMVKQHNQSVGGHAIPIRDMCLRQLNDMLVTRSLEKCTKL